MKRSVGILGVMWLLVWLGLPGVVAADDCRDFGENERNAACPTGLKFLGFFTGMALTAAGLGWRKGARPPGYLRRVPKGGMPGKDGGGGARSPWRPAGSRDGVSPGRGPSPNQRSDGSSIDRGPDAWDPGTQNTPRGPVPPQSD